MKKISLFALLLSISYVSTAPAQVKADGEQYRTTWGVTGDFKRCEGLGKDAGFSDASVGTDSAWDSYLNKSFTENGKGGWGYGAWYWVAHEMANHGYKFCKTAVGADRSCLTCDPYTLYGVVKNQTKDAGENCFWLCEKGYYGTGCKSADVTAVVPNESDFNIIKNRAKIATGGVNALSSNTLQLYKDNNIENSIPMFYNGVYESCSGGLQINLRKMTKKQEHDVVLAIKKIETSGSRVTYTLQPMVVRAASAKGDSNSGWPMISWTGNENNTYCPESKFLHSEDGGGCIGYDKDVANAQDISNAEKTKYEAAMEKAATIEKSGLDILCPGWPKEKFDNTVHVLNSEAFEYQNWRKVGNTTYNVTKEDFLGTDIGTKEEYIGAKDKNEYVNTQCANATAKTGCMRSYAERYDKLSKEYDEKKAASDAYDNAQTSASATCTIFVCKDDSMGYASDPMVSGDFTCVSCAENSDKTIHHSRLGRGSDGICKVCKVGETVKNGQCEKSKSIHKFYMDGMNKKTSGGIEAVDNLADQCWTKPTPDEYKACIKAFGLENSGGENNDIIPPLNKGLDGLVVDFGDTVSK